MITEKEKRISIMIDNQLNNKLNQLKLKLLIGGHQVTKKQLLTRLLDDKIDKMLELTEVNFNISDSKK